MEDLSSRKGERVAVKVELEAFPLKKAPIPPCRLQSIAITRGTEVGSFVLFIGTDSGHLLRYNLLSPIVQDSSSAYSSPSQTPPQHSAYTPSSLPVPPLTLPPSPAPISVPLGGSSSIISELSISPRSDAVSSSSPFENASEVSHHGTAATTTLTTTPSPSPALKSSGRERNGLSSPQLPSSYSPIKQLHSTPAHLRPSSAAPQPALSSSRESRLQESNQSFNSSAGPFNSGQLTSLPSRLSTSPSSPAAPSLEPSNSVPSNFSLPADPATPVEQHKTRHSTTSPAAPSLEPSHSVPSNFSMPADPATPVKHHNDGAQASHPLDVFKSNATTRPSSPVLSAATAFADSKVGAGKAGVEMILTACNHVSKTPIESLCPLPQCGRLAILSDGHVALLDLQHLNVVDRLPGTKGAVTMARGLDSTLPIPYRSSFMVLEGLPEQKTKALVTRNEAPANKMFGRGKLSSRLGGLVGGLDKAFSTGRGEVDPLKKGRPGRMGNLIGTAKPPIDSSGRPSGEQAVKGFGRLAVAVKRKIVLFEIQSSEQENGERREGGLVRRNGDALKMREVTGIEGVVTMAWLGDVILAGTRHEYLLFSLTSGLPTHLFSLPQEVPWPPLLKAFPRNREALLLIDNAGIPINTEGHPSGGSLLFQILPDGIGYSSPYVLVAKQGTVEIYHHRTGTKIQSLSLADGGKTKTLVADDEDGTYIIIANSFKVCCLRQVPLDEQLKELLKHKAFKEAERLAEEGQAESDGDSTKTRLAMVHAEAGFLHLFDLHFQEAVDQFLLSDIMEPSELFPFFPSLTARWRTMVPRKRYWGLHPPPQAMRMVIESGLLAMQSGLLKSQGLMADGSDVGDIFVGLKSGKDSLVERYFSQAMENVARYLGIIREKRELKALEKEGVDTLLMKLYCELEASSELEELAASSNSCVLEEVETLLKGAGQLHALALLYESKGLWSLALRVWQTLAHAPTSPSRAPRGVMKKHQLRSSTTGQAVALTEAVRLLEQSSDTDLVLQHIGWIINLDPSLALDVLTSSKRADPLSPEDTLLALEADGGIVQQRYLLWLVQEQGLEDSFYHTELALSLARSSVSTLERDDRNSAESESTTTHSVAADQRHRSLQQLHEETSSSTSSSSITRKPRDALLAFLETSDGYDAKSVLNVIKGSRLWNEQFVLHRKLGDEISALRTLALKLEDSAAAERYCAEIGRPEAYQELMDMYLNPGEGREPMHRAAVRLLHCHGAPLDPLQVFEALSPDMPLGSAAETIAQLMVARVHRRRQGQIVRQLVRKDNLEARISRVEERSRSVCITSDSTCGSCGARIGTKLFALYPDDAIYCYKCLRRYGENARPVNHRNPDRSHYSVTTP